jgi:hypothetical protein
VMDFDWTNPDVSATIADDCVVIFLMFEIVMYSFAWCGNVTSVCAGIIKHQIK